MSIPEIVLPTFFLLLLAYFLHSLPSRLQPQHTHRLSQAFSRGTSRSSRPGQSGWTFSYSGLTLSLSTTGLNTVPKLLLGRFRPANQDKIRRFYDIGAYAGVLGGVLGIGVGFWVLVDVWREVWWEVGRHAASGEGGGAVRVLKRALSGESAGATTKEVIRGGLQPQVRLLVACRCGLA